MFGQYWLRVHVILHIWQESIISLYTQSLSWLKNMSLYKFCAHILEKYGGLYALFNITTRFIRVGYMDDYD